MVFLPVSFFFFFNDTATTEIYTLSLHDALPISCPGYCCLTATPSSNRAVPISCAQVAVTPGTPARVMRSEEHTSELQSQSNLVCRLLLEKKKLYLLQLCTRLILPVS